MQIHPSYVKLRSKGDSDYFLSKEIKYGNVWAKKFELSDTLAGKTVKVESVLGKYNRKRFIVSYTDAASGNKSFQTIHPSSIWFQYYWEIHDKEVESK